MPDMSCFFIGGMKNQHDTILESFGTTAENRNSLTRWPSTTYSPLSSSLLRLKFWTLLFFCSSQSSKLIKVKFRLGRKVDFIEVILNQILA